MMNSRAYSRRYAASAVQPRRTSGSAARPKSGLLRRIGRIALCGVIGFVVSSIVLVALYRVLPPPRTPLMLIRSVEGYGIDKSWRRLDDISPHLIRAAMAGEDTRFCRHHGFDWGAIETAGITIRADMAACWAPAPSRCRPPRMSSCGPAVTGCAKGSRPGLRR
jgi:membrane peptidoglycan carboxypeptidase